MQRRNAPNGPYKRLRPRSELSRLPTVGHEELYTDRSRAGRNRGPLPLKSYLYGGRPFSVQHNTMKQSYVTDYLAT
jgi:hypothetical protein